MKKGNISIGIAIAIAMTAVLMVSGCVEDIGEKEYCITLIVDEKRPVAIDSKYVLLLKQARYYGVNGEAVIEIFSGVERKYSIGQVLLKKDNGEKTIDKLTISLINVDSQGEYAEIIVKESHTEVDIAPALKAGETIKKVAEGVVESAAQS